MVTTHQQPPSGYAQYLSESTELRGMLDTAVVNNYHFWLALALGFAVDRYAVPEVDPNESRTRRVGTLVWQVALLGMAALLVRRAVAFLGVLPRVGARAPLRGPAADTIAGMPGLLVGLFMTQHKLARRLHLLVPACADDSCRGWVSSSSTQ